MKRCLQCGAGNEHGNHCAQCGATLPKVDLSISGDTSTTRLRVKYELLRKEILKIQGGQLSWEEFAEWLQVFHDDIQARMQYLIECIQQSHGPGWNYYDDFQEEVEMTFSGLEDYEAALQRLWNAVDEQSLPEATGALALFLRGAEKLNDSLAINAQIQREKGFDVGGFL